VDLIRSDAVAAVVVARHRFTAGQARRLAALLLSAADEVEAPGATA